MAVKDALQDLVVGNVLVLVLSLELYFADGDVAVDAVHNQAVGSPSTKLLNLSVSLARKVVIPRQKLITRLTELESNNLIVKQLGRTLR